MISLNETPVKTSRNFQINNISLEEDEILEEIREFRNVNIKTETSKVKISNGTSNIDLKFGLGNKLENQVKNMANQKIKIVIDSKVKNDIEISFKFDDKNVALIDDIEIIAEENSKANIIIKYENEKEKKYYHNGIIRVVAKNNSNITLNVINFLNINSNNFIGIENLIEKDAKLNYVIIDFGGKNSITNYYSNLIGDNSNNTLNSVYLGKENQVFDLNYIGELRGKNSNIDIEVQGALKDCSKKKFKGTIDFKKGSKKSKGNENEFCMLLSNEARSISLPMLLCSEEEIEGNHSSSSGRADEKELFYIMSRGFERKEAMKLLVRANFNTVIKNIKNEGLKCQIIEEMDKRLD